MAEIQIHLQVVEPDVMCVDFILNATEVENSSHDEEEIYSRSQTCRRRMILTFSRRGSRRRGQLVVVPVIYRRGEEDRDGPGSFVVEVSE